MSKIIERYLKYINKNESIFPIDSPATGKPLRPAYPGQNEIPVTLSNNKKKTILVDFDGVLHDYKEGWNDGKLGNPIPGAKEAIDKLKDKYQIVIFTSRASREANQDNVENMVSKVKDWLNKHGIHHDRITSEKIPAILYIDDKAIKFDHNWNEIDDYLQRKDSSG